MKLRLVMAAGLALLAGGAAAAGPDVKLSGYATLGAVATDSDEVQYRASTNQDRGAQRSPDLGVDSRLGLQASAEFGHGISAVGQLLALRANGRQGARVEWLYAQAKPSEWVDLRAGRLVLPVFLLSDSRNVGYAAHFVRTPQEVYGQYPLSSFDGVQVQGRTTLGGVNITAQLSAGKSEGKIGGPPLLTWNSDSIRSVNLVAEYGDWMLRYGLTKGRTTITGFPFPMPQTDERFTGVGAQYDNGTLLVLAEHVTRRQDSRGGDADAWYLSAGWRLGTLTPYVTHGGFKPKGLAFQATTGLASTGTNAVGMRWDAWRNVAIKAQVERTNSGTTLYLPSDAFRARGDKLTAYSLAADFVF